MFYINSFNCSPFCGVYFNVVGQLIFAPGGQLSKLVFLGSSVKELWQVSQKAVPFC